MGTISFVVLVKNASSASNRSRSNSVASSRRDVQRPPQLQHERASDTRQQPGAERRRLHDAVLDDEEIRLRALRQFAAIVAEHRFGGVGADCLLHAQRVVDQVVALDQRRHRLRVISDDLFDHHHARALLVGGRGRVGQRLGDDHQRRHGARGRVVGDLADAAREHQAHVGFAAAVAQTGGGHGAHAPFEDVLVRERHLQLNAVRGRPQPRHVRAEQERPAVVGAKHLVDALAVKEAMVVDGDDRGGGVGDAAVDVDESSHGPGSYSRRRALAPHATGVGCRHA